MTEATGQSKVATASKAQSKMVQESEIVRTLVGGTPAMRAAGEKYLPKAEAESQEAYKARLLRSVLFNATGKTVSDMTGKVFTKPIVLEKDVPAELVAFAENIDLTGRHLNVFARDVFADTMQPGIGYIYVDMPPAVENADGSAPTLAQEQEAGLRPYLTYIPMERLIGWKSESIGGVETLTQIRIKECVSEPDGDFHEKEVDQVRVVSLVAGGLQWQTFRKSADPKAPDDWISHQGPKPIKGPKAIPLAPVYINRTEFMQGAPPLAKIAELNVAHWQSSSDQRNILHVARVPILYMAGFQADDQVKIGASEAVRSSNPDAKMEYVEHSGQAIESGEKDLERLEFQMQTMGLQLLIPQPGGKTATGEMRDDAKENSPLAMMARALQDALEQAFGFMAEFKGVNWKKKDGGGSIIVNTDFGVQAGASQDAQMLLDAVNAGQIDKETFWLEWKRRGILSDSFDPAKAKARIAEEAPELDSGAGKGMNLDGGPPPAK